MEAMLDGFRVSHTSFFPNRYLYLKLFEQPGGSFIHQVWDNKEISDAFWNLTIGLEIGWSIYPA